MAISQTMSNSSDWLLPAYQTDFSAAVHLETPPTIPTVNTSAARTSSLVPAADHGRISKPIRRRSRASRRTPTTLLNTDAANFRAMVQQFTGGPAARFAAAASHHVPAAGAMLGFGAPTPMPPVANTSTTAAASVAGGFHVQFPNQTMQQMYGMDNVNRGGYSPAAPAAAATEMNRSDYGNYMMLR